MSENNCSVDLAPACYGSTKLGERGQIVIPKKLREKLSLKKGDGLLVMEKHGSIILTTPSILQEMVSNLTEGLSNISK